LIKDKKTSDNLIVSVLYDHGIKFINDFTNSINEQDTEDFDIIIYDDTKLKKIPKLQLNKEHSLISHKNISKISSVRFYIFKYAIKKGYKNLFFFDLDDYQSGNRISESIKYLDKYDITFNDIIITDNKLKVQNKNIISKYLKKNYIINFKRLLKGNFIGFGNMGIKLSKNILLENFPNIVALDWYFVLKALHQNKKFFFITNAKTYYRQHTENLIGSKKKLSIFMICNIINQRHNIFMHLKKFIIRYSGNKTLLNYNNHIKKIDNELALLKKLNMNLENKNVSYKITSEINRLHKKNSYLWWFIY
jgi:hypothetical protein